jgi:hypothetical protein
MAATRRALDRGGVPGLARFSDISNQCSYARITLDDGNRQIAVMLMHLPDDVLDLNEAGDQGCILGFFARNLNMTVQRVRDRIVPPGFVSTGACEVARIVRRGYRPDTVSWVAANCPQPPIMRADFVYAYARANGLGLTSEERRLFPEAARQSCYGTRPSAADRSCPTLLSGEE